MTAEVEIAQRAEAVAGLPTMFVGSPSGFAGSFGVFTGCEATAARSRARPEALTAAVAMQALDRCS